MSKRDEIARANRQHLFEPINLISFIIIAGMITLFNHYQLKEYVVGYAISTAFIVSQVLLTTRARVKINPATLLITEPFMISGMVILACYIINRM